MNLLLAFLLYVAPSGNDEPDSFIREYKTTVVVSQGRKTVSQKVVIQINNKLGNWLSTVTIPYSKGNRVKSLEAAITDLNGNVIRKLKNKDIIDRSSISNISLYEDDFVKEFELNHNSYPYLIEYSYSQEFDEFISIVDWHPNFRNLNTLMANLEVTLPIDYGVNIIEQNLEDQKEVHLTEGAYKYKWDFEVVDRVITESGSPAWHEVSPGVLIVPENFAYGLPGSSYSWDEYGDWVYALGEDTDDFTEDQKTVIRKKVEGIADKKEIVKKLYHDLQDNCRYINVSIDIGGLKPYPASYVETNKYGDCKALTYYMKSALNVFDIESFPVDVLWDDRELINDTLPTQQFNHVFLCVPIEEDTLWLENTSSYYPFNYLDVDKRNKKGLLVDKGRSRLINIPKMAMDEAQCISSISYEIMEDHLKGEMNAELRGQLFESYLARKVHWAHGDFDSWVKESFPIRNSIVTDWRIEDRDRDQPYLNFNATFTQNGGTKDFGPNKVVYIPSSSLPNLESPEDRKYELRKFTPTLSIDTIRYKVDEVIYGTIKVPENFRIDSDYGSYTLKYEYNQEVVSCIRKLEIYPGRFEIGSMYQGYYDFIDKIRKYERETYITLKP